MRAEIKGGELARHVVIFIIILVFLSPTFEAADRNVCLPAPASDALAGRPHPHSGFFSVTVGRRHHRNMSLMTIAKHVILSGAKNLPSSRLDVRRMPSPTRMRGGLIALALPQDDRFGDCPEHSNAVNTLARRRRRHREAAPGRERPCQNPSTVR